MSYRLCEYLYKAPPPPPQSSFVFQAKLLEFFYEQLDIKIEQTLIIVEYNGSIECPRKSKTSLIYHLTITSEVDRMS